MVLIVREKPASEIPILNDSVTPFMPAATRFGFPILSFSDTIGGFVSTSSRIQSPHYQLILHEPV
ncbi:MAG: Uncharacterised protein [Marine Group II euryarchaeote MED-G33]|nr:MAG: Uncharacterised protein [Marine Group II euryarchaeote MED-G33]